MSRASAFRWASSTRGRPSAPSDVLIKSGLKSRVLTDIRAEIWLKAWGRLTFNPISALSHATIAGICRFPETRKLAIAMMTEAQEIASKPGSPSATRSSSASKVPKRWESTRPRCCRTSKPASLSKMRP